MTLDCDIYSTVTFSREVRDELDDAATALRQMARRGSTFYGSQDLFRMAGVIEELTLAWKLAGEVTRV